MQTDADKLGFVLAVADSDTHVQKAAQVADTAAEVALFYKDREINIKQIELVSPEILTGVVSSVTNVCSMHYEGLKLGQKITFRYPHIHHLTKKD